MALCSSSCPSRHWETSQTWARHGADLAIALQSRRLHTAGLAPRVYLCAPDPPPWLTCALDGFSQRPPGMDAVPHSSVPPPSVCLLTQFFCSTQLTAHALCRLQDSSSWHICKIASAHLGVGGLFPQASQCGCCVLWALFLQAMSLCYLHNCPRLCLLCPGARLYLARQLSKPVTNQ